MSNLTTKLITSLLQGKPVDEFFRSELETAVNKLLTAELTAYLGYERYSSDGWGSGNSRNDFYERMLLLADYGEIQQFRIVLDENGVNKLLEAIKANGNFKYCKDSKEITLDDKAIARVVDNVCHAIQPERNIMEPKDYYSK